MKTSGGASVLTRREPRSPVEDNPRGYNLPDKIININVYMYMNE